MNTKLLMVLIALLVSVTARAGGGGMTGGATEVTQIVNMVQLVQSYDQQVMSYQNQILQYDTMLRNLAKNPNGVIAPDLTAMVQGQARLLSVGTDIASSMSKVDLNFAKNFTDSAGTTALDFGTKFKNLTNTSQDALKAAMLNAGLQRENFPSDQAAIQKLVDNVSAADGAVGGLQALGSLNAAQIQESVKLRDLISQQQVAQNTFMAAQAAKDQAKQDATATKFNRLTPTDLSTYSNPKF